MSGGERGPAIAWYGLAAVMLFAVLHAWLTLAITGTLPISGRPSISSPGWSRAADPFTRGFFAGAVLYGFGFVIGIVALMLARSGPSDAPATVTGARRRLRRCLAMLLGAIATPMVIVAGRSLLLAP